MNLKSSLSLHKMTSNVLSPYEPLEKIADYVENLEKEVNALKKRVENLEKQKNSQEQTE